MMKKYVALGVALILLLSLTACGPKEDKNPAKDPATTTTTVEGVTDSTTTTVADGTAGGDTTTDIPASTTVTKKPTTTVPTTQYVPGGTQVPIGTRPPTTTTTKKPVTTTTVTGNTPSGTGTTTSAPTTTTTTTTVAKPTNPPADQHYIALPEIGSDIDVTRKKNRIRVSDALAWYNEDGTIGVSLTFKNYTSNWITQETDYVDCTAYDKNGKVLMEERIYIGVIDTKRHPVKTFEFSVPAAAYEVKITKSEITYWTEWA